MDIFESTFGIIRSVLNICDYSTLAEQLNEHLDTLYDVDPLRCNEVVCPYVERALHGKHFARESCGPFDLKDLKWAHLTPALFDYDLNWPNATQWADRWFEEGIRVPYSIMLSNNQAATLSALMTQQWIAQVKAIIFYHLVTIEQVEVFATTQDLSGLSELWFYDRVELDVLHRLVQLSCMQDVEVIHIISQDCGDWSGEHIDCLNQLPKLHDFTIRSENGTAIEIQSISPHPNLANFDHIHVENVDDPSWFFANPLFGLRTLSCCGCALPDGVLQTCLQSIQAHGLKYLDISYNGLQPAELVHLAPLMPKTLQALAISGNSVDVESVQSFVDVGVLRTLTALSLGHCQLNNDSGELLLMHLEGEYNRLALFANQMTGKALAHLGNNTKIRTLTNLLLSSNPLGADALAGLSGASWLPTLSGLYLGECQLDAVDAAQFLLSPRLKSPTHINLRQNELDNRFIESLIKGLPVWQGLSLDLSENRLDEKGLLLLASWPGFAQLNSLNLRKNNITLTMDVFKTLARSPHLRDLTLNLDAIDDSLNAEIEKAQLFSPSVRLFFY